jgi:hypothetical protein
MWALRAPVPRNTDRVREVVLARVREANGRGTAKRLLPVARAAGYTGSDRNFRRLVAVVKRQVRGEIGRHQRRPAVWTPGETLVIDWGLLPGGLHVFCAVLAWSRVRFVRIARDETAATTLVLPATLSAHESATFRDDGTASVDEDATLPVSPG